MADNILTQPCGIAPPLNTVLLWLTTPVERDMAARGIFQNLRHASAHAHRGSASLHFLTEDQAGTVLADGLAREQQVSKSLRTAYKAHIKRVQEAMKEAAERPSTFASTKPVSSDTCQSHERWRGTKDQLKAHGIQLDGPWPHELGGKERWAQARDSRGYKTIITRFSTIWPGLYEAYISIPFEVWGRKHKEKPKASEADLARRSLTSMPCSADDLRARLIDSLRAIVGVNLDMAVKPATYHGYTLDEGAVDEIQASFDVVVEAVVAARVKFDSALHADIAQKYRAQIAAADQTFQAQLETLLHPNPRFLEGDGQ